MRHNSLATISGAAFAALVVLGMPLAAQQPNPPPPGQAPGIGIPGGPGFGRGAEPRHTDPRRSEKRVEPSPPRAAPKAPNAKGPVAKGPTAKGPAAKGQALPETAEGRAKLLSTLYAHLATADNETTARPLVEIIERLWLQSGSDTVSLLMERALQATNAKNHELALRLMNVAVELAPDHAEAFNRRAYVYYQRNEYDLAMGDLRRTLALEPNHYKALDGLVQILREMGQKKAALQAHRQLMTVHPFWPGGEETTRELEREVEGQGI